MTAISEIFASLDLETQLDVIALEEVGIRLGEHYGAIQAHEIRLEMDAAFAGGTLYQWLGRFGIGGGE